MGTTLNSWGELFSLTAAADLEIHTGFELKQVNCDVLVVFSARISL
jgi:hypothetical protein